MLKKLNTKTLIIVLTVLVAMVLLTKIFDDKKGGRTFKEELVNIDTSLVNIILVYPNADQHKEIKMEREGEGWTVREEKITSEADSMYIRNLLGTFALVKPQRLAATEESKWKDYNVNDSLGTRVKFFAGEKILMDIVVGKFSYNQASRAGISYLRLFSDDDVYAVDGFIPMAVNQPFNEWRNKNILRGNKDDWTKISFSYSDSGFVLAKENGRWMIENADMDSGKVEQYLTGLSNLSNSSFVDNYSLDSTPAFWLTIEGNNMAAPVTIKAFPADSSHRYIINSSFNPSAWFSAAKGNLSDRIFKKLPDFLKQAPVEEKK